MMKYKEKIGKIITGILLSIIIFIFFIMIYNFIQLKLLKRPYVNFFGYAVFEVVSESMAPSIRKSDIIIVKITKDIKADDIITYKEGENFITHRVIDIQGNYYITRGDANNSKDNPIISNAILGKVVKVFPKLGVWQTIFTTPTVIISLMITLGLFSFVFSYKKKSKIQCVDFGIYYNSIIEEYGEKYDK